MEVGPEPAVEVYVVAPTVTLHPTPLSRPFSVNVAVNVGPLAVYVADADGEVLDTTPEPPAVIV